MPRCCQWNAPLPVITTQPPHTTHFFQNPPCHRWIRDNLEEAYRTLQRQAEGGSDGDDDGDDDFEDVAAAAAAAGHHRQGLLRSELDYPPRIAAPEAALAARAGKGSEPALAAAAAAAGPAHPTHVDDGNGGGGSGLGLEAAAGRAAGPAALLQQLMGEEEDVQYGTGAVGEGPGALAPPGEAGAVGPPASQQQPEAAAGAGPGAGGGGGAMHPLELVSLWPWERFGISKDVPTLRAVAATASTSNVSQHSVGLSLSGGRGRGLASGAGSASDEGRRRSASPRGPRSAGLRRVAAGPLEDEEGGRTLATGHGGRGGVGKARGARGHGRGGAAAAAGGEDAGDGPGNRPAARRRKAPAGGGEDGAGEGMAAPKRRRRVKAHVAGVGEAGGGEEAMGEGGEAAEPGSRPLAARGSSGRQQLRQRAPAKRRRGQRVVEEEEDEDEAGEGEQHGVSAGTSRWGGGGEGGNQPALVASRCVSRVGVGKQAVEEVAHRRPEARRAFKGSCYAAVHNPNHRPRTRCGASRPPSPLPPRTSALEIRIPTHFLATPTANAS